MTHAGKILGETLTELVSWVKPGVTELEIDQKAEELIVKKGGEPGFKRVEDYHHTICISVNDVVVHGIPKRRKIHEGDVVGIDCGVYYNGYHTDMAETIVISDSKLRTKQLVSIDRFLATGKKALIAGILAARGGNRVGDISSAIQSIVEANSYSVVRSLVGHGVGRELHEEPEIPGYLEGKIENTPLLVPGMTIAVEVIYNMGKPNVIYEGSDDWTISSEDGSLSGLFERTIQITDGAPIVLTPLGGESIVDSQA